MFFTHLLHLFTTLHKRRFNLTPTCIFCQQFDSGTHALKLEIPESPGLAVQETKKNIEHLPRNSGKFLPFREEMHHPDSSQNLPRPRSAIAQWRTVRRTGGPVDRSDRTGRLGSTKRSTHANRLTHLKKSVTSQVVRLFHRLGTQHRFPPHLPVEGREARRCRAPWRRWWSLRASQTEMRSRSQVAGLGRSLGWTVGKMISLGVQSTIKRMVKIRGTDFGHFPVLQPVQI